MIKKTVTKHYFLFNLNSEQYKQLWNSAHFWTIYGRCNERKID